VRKLIRFLPLFILIETSQATLVSYEVNDLGGNRFQYEYSVLNDGLSSLDNFSLFFDQSYVSNISIDAIPVDWNANAYQPDLSIPDDGFVDTYTYAVPLANGYSLTGLTVSFDWSGLSLPSEQRFEIFDANWNLIDSGFTQLVAQVNEPTSGALLSMGIVGLCLSRRRRNTGSEGRS
jgi:hypothetical protein